MSIENQWDKRYNVPDYLYGTSPNDFLNTSSRAGRYGTLPG